MANQPHLYLVRLDVEPTAKDKIAQWSNQRHMPDLLEAGFFSTTRYRSLEGQPEYMHLYEIPGVEIFDTPAYKAICRCEPPCAGPVCLNKKGSTPSTGKQMTSHLSNNSRAVYEQLLAMKTISARVRSPGRMGNPVGNVRSRYLWTVRFDLAAGTENAYSQWFENGHMAEILTASGFISGRFCRRIDSFSTSEPKYLTMWELVGPDVFKNNPKLDEIHRAPAGRVHVANMQNRKNNMHERIFPA